MPAARAATDAGAAEARITALRVPADFARWPIADIHAARRQPGRCRDDVSIIMRQKTAAHYPQTPPRRQRLMARCHTMMPPGLLPARRASKHARYFDYFFAAAMPMMLFERNARCRRADDAVSVARRRKEVEFVSRGTPPRDARRCTPDALLIIIFPQKPHGYAPDAAAMPAPAREETSDTLLSFHAPPPRNIVYCAPCRRCTTRHSSNAVHQYATHRCQRARRRAAARRAPARRRRAAHHAGAPF